MGRELPTSKELMLRVMRILWKWQEEKGDEAMPVDLIVMKYVATHFEGAGREYVPRMLTELACEEIIEEISTQPNRWWHRLLRWLWPPQSLLLHPPLPDPTAHYRALFTEEQFRAQMPDLFEGE